MADYYELIDRAVASLGKNTDEPRRSALYAHARGVLVIELCRITPPLSEPDITHECLLFEEAVQKIEATFTRSASDGTALTPAPQSAPISATSGQSACTEGEYSEAFKPGGEIPKFGDIEPPNGLTDESRPPWLVSHRTSDVVGRPDIPIGEGINNYILEKPVADFSHGLLWPFIDVEYDTCRKDFGIQRSFPGEVFYTAADNVFLGKKATRAIVMAAQGKVAKIYFVFIHKTESDCREFLHDANRHLSTKYGPPSGIHDTERERNTVFWDKSFGNVTIETNLFWYRTAIIYTSFRVRLRTRGWLSRILGSL